jgi:hypothetical protein
MGKAVHSRGQNHLAEAGRKQEVARNARAGTGRTMASNISNYFLKVICSARYDYRPTASPVGFVRSPSLLSYMGQTALMAIGNRTPTWCFRRQTLKRMNSVEGYVVKLRFRALVCALALVAAAASVEAQTRPSNRANQGAMQFDDHARQTTRDWYNQHQSRPPAGLRSRDRLSADQEGVSLGDAKRRSI